MLQNVTKKLSQNQEKAAALVAADVLTDDDIASEVGIKRQTLWRWKKTEEFSVRVSEITEAARKAIVERGILEKQNRLEALRDRQKLMADVIRQRAEYLKDVAGGGSTGLLVKR